MKKTSIFSQFFLLTISISSLSLASAKSLSVEDALKRNFPKESIAVTHEVNQVTLEGEVSNSNVMKKALNITKKYSGKKQVVNNLAVKHTASTHHVTSNQVMLRVRFGEINRSDLKNVNSCAVSPKSLTHCIDSLSKKGVFKIYSEPSLVAMSGETAQFISGGELPIPVTDVNGNLRSVSFKPHGIKVVFSPKVINSHKIRLNIEYEVSEVVKSDARALPVFSTNQASTTVELAPGESFMIAGMVKDNSEMSTSNKHFSFASIKKVFSPLIAHEQKEIVVAVTPYLVTPIANDEIKLPTDNFNVETELDKLLKSKMNNANDASVILE